MPIRNLNASQKTKHTPVGEIPVEWGSVRIGEIAEVRQGRTFSPRFQGKHGRWAWAKVGDMDARGNAKWLSNVANHIGDGDLKELGIEPFRGHSTVFPRVGAALQTNKKRLLPEAMVVDDNILVVTVSTQSLCHEEFLFYWFCSINLERLFANAGPVPSIRGKTVLNTRIPLPPLPEQRKIAEILSTWDRAIAQTEKLIEAKERLKKGLMQRLLTGQLRFPKFRSKSWQTYKIGKLLKEVRRPITWDDNDLYELISIKRRSGGLFHRDSLYGWQIMTKNLRVARTGDFLISKMQVVHGACGLTTPEFDGMKISGSYIALVARDPHALLIEYFDNLSKMPIMYHAAYISSYGVHIEKMTFNQKLYMRTEICIPPTVEEQERIVSVLHACDTELSLLRHKMEALRQQKKGLMQKLLTGQVRVSTKEDIGNAR